MRHAHRHCAVVDGAALAVASNVIEQSHASVCHTTPAGAGAPGTILIDGLHGFAHGSPLCFALFLRHG